MRKAYSYIRMSTDIQLKGDSFRRQLEASVEFARNNNLELVDSIDGTKLQDLGVSAFRGKNTTQGTLSRFLNYINEGKIEPNSVLLIESLDRLSRNKITSSLALFMDIINAGIEIITLTDDQRYTKDSINQNPGSIYISLGIMFRANEESEIKSKRLKSAWSNKRTQAISSKKPMTKTTPSWLTLKTDRSGYELDKAKSKVVREIFNLCANTTGIHGITNYLNETKTPTFNGSRYWHQSYVARILNSRAVLGEYHPHHYVNGKRTSLDEPIKDFFPAVITEEEFNLAHAAINIRSNAKGRKGNTFSNILTGLVYCQCGSKVRLDNKGKHVSDKRFVCYAKHFKAGCKNDPWIYAEALELLFNHLKEINFDELLKTDNSLEKELYNSISNLEQVNHKLGNQINNVLDLVSDESLSAASKKAFVQKMNSLTEQFEENVEQISNQKLELEKLLASKQALNHEHVNTLLDKLKDTDDYMFRASVNNLLSKFIERIVLVPSEAYIPWEIKEDSPEVKAYKKLHPDLSFDEIIEREKFQRLFRKMNRTMLVKFRFGANRIIRGDGLTYYNKIPFKPKA